MKNGKLTALGLTLAALALPLAGDGTTNESSNCFRATTSLAAGTLQPVAGDENFFNSNGPSGAAGPSSIMFLLDNSGSMTDLPQCDAGAGNGNCGWTSPTVPADPSVSPYLPTVNGTCDYTANTTLKWMNAVVPTTAFADPGYNISGQVVDLPPWSPAAGASACAGNSSCLFDPAGVYLYGNWTETSATKQLGDGCTLYAGATPVTDDYGHTVTAGSACTTCLANSGFYIGRVRYVSKKKANGTPQNFATFSTGMLFSGKWLNANAPKYVSARRAIKQLLKIDPATPLARDRVRYGLATFWGRDRFDNALNTANGGNTGGIQLGDGARLMVPLGPDCAGKYTYVQNRQAIVNSINATSPPIRFETNTPLAEALFNIAQYFSATGATGVHEKRFGTLWEKNGSATNPYPSPLTYDPGADFQESSPGAVLAPWAITGGSASACTLAPGNKCPANADQASICWGCQVSGAIVVTDGMPNNESGLPLAGVSTNHADQPAWDFQFWKPTQYSSVCGGMPFGTGDACQSYLPLVALYMFGNDFRDAGNMAGIQNVVVHTISFGIAATSQAAKVLQATATLGGGKFANTQSTADLEAALVRAVNNVVQRATSFSAANANALQTNRNSATETFFARFKPNATRAWKGHLIQAILFDEFAMGCDTTMGPTDQAKVACGNTTVYPNFDGNVDAAGKNICDGIFLVDSDCKEITEDKNGDFVLVDGGAPANLPWDAGVALSTPSSPGYKSGAESTAVPPPTNLRRIQTCVAPSGGTATSACAMTDFTTANVDLLYPAMSLDQAFCAKLIQDAAACGGTCPVPGSTWTVDNTRKCAKLIIYYVRGYDTMDQDGDGCASPINSANAACSTTGEERNIGTTGKKVDFWKLGDIFHSTPAVVKPPIDELRCDLGYDPQCVATIHSPAGLVNQTPIVQTYAGLTTGSKVDAYESWRIARKDRKRVVLAGANDGMLHAFDGGDALTGQPAEPLTGVFPYSQGSAAELWAFIPPDLLPRLKFLLYGHQYMVDGSAMVRDVWVDGGPTGGGTKDGIKQNDEFHTIAVISERSGGTQFTGLDITDPQNPRYLWTFPPPGSDDARYMGESWADFAPRPPPIGPVRISKGGSAWEERWVVMLNGGYDPAMVKGRAVFMVDAWTGQTVWRFTNDDFKAQQAGAAPAAMFPVPAAVGLIDLGDPTRPQLDADGFFDTATWGDLGGNVWVARFQQNGVIGSSGRVENWFAARTFEQQRRTDDLQYVRADGSFAPPLGQVRSEFYFMTANVYEGTTRTMRTYIGGGNREQMLETSSQPGCGPDNLLGCCRSGCTDISTSTVDDFGACNRTQTFRCQNGLLTLAASTTNCAGAPVCAAPSKNTYSNATTFSFTCGGVTRTENAGLTCDVNGICSAYSELSSQTSRDISTSLLTDSGSHNRFYGFWSYGRDPKKMFDDVDPTQALAKAKLFDANRFTDVSYSGTCSGPAGNTCTLLDATTAKVNYDALNPASALSTTCGGGVTRCQATVDDAGWFYEYGRGCPVKTCDPPPPWSDEKTSAGANVVLGCASWSGFRPIGSNSIDPSNPCNTSIGNPTSYGYVAHFVTGTPTRSCGYADNGTVYRSAQRNTWSPPSAATARVTVNAKGQVSYSTLNLDPGAPPAQKTLGTRADVVEPVYWMEVPRPLHQCRHVDGSSCE